MTENIFWNLIYNLIIANLVLQTPKLKEENDNEPHFYF